MSILSNSVSQRTGRRIWVLSRSCPFIYMINKIKTMLKDLSFVLFYLMRIFPIKSNKIIFSNFLGKGYGDNPKYICDELIKSNADYDLVWLINDKNEINLPTQVRSVKINRIRAIYELATARVWIDNCRKGLSVRKRKKQLYVQTWHSGIGPKKIEKAAINRLSKHYIKEAKHDSKMIDLILAGSEWEQKNFIENFWYNGPILKVGLPRQDIFWSNNEERIREIKDRLGLGSTKVFVYAPTFKKTDEDNLKSISINWSQLLSTLEKKFGGNWTAGLRLHPNAAYMINKIKLPSNVIDLTWYNDPQEIVLVSDAMISDISSILFESAMIGTPSFAYINGNFHNINELCFDLSEMPFETADTFDALLDSISHFDQSDYENRCNEFFINRCGIIKNDHSAKNVVAVIMDIIGSKASNKQ